LVGQNNRIAGAGDHGVFTPNSKYHASVTLANCGPSSTLICAAIRAKSEVNSHSVLWGFWQYSV